MMRIQQMRPPYRVALRPVTDGPGAGEVLVVTTDAAELANGLVDTVSKLRVERPWAHVVVQVRDLQPAMLNLIRMTFEVGVVASDQHLNRDDLRTAFGSEARRFIDSWILEQRPGLRDDVCASIKHALGGATEEREFHLTSSGRRKLHARMEIPSADSISRLHRALHATLTLQRDDSETVLSAAIRGGFYDAASLSESLWRLTGVRPSVARRFVGARWLLWQWWNKAGLCGRCPIRTDQALIDG